MTSPSTQTLTLSHSDAKEADAISRRLEDVPADELRVVVTDSNGDRVEVSTNLAAFLRSALRAASSDRHVSLMGLPEQLTSAEAARKLGISRPTLLKMAREDKIPSHKVGSHTRFFTHDVQELAHRLTDNAAASLNALRDAELAED